MDMFRPAYDLGCPVPEYLQQEEDGAGSAFMRLSKPEIDGFFHDDLTASPRVEDIQLEYEAPIEEAAMLSFNFERNKT